MQVKSLVAAALAAVTLTAAGCTSSGPSGRSGSSSPSQRGSGSSSLSGSVGAGASADTLVVWADNSDSTANAITPLCQSWAAKNRITCDVQLFNGAADLRAALENGNRTGAVPDVFEGPHDEIGELVDDGVLAPVDLTAHTADFLPPALAAMTYDGKTWGVPWSAENVAMMTNKKLVPTCPATLDDTVATAKTLIAAGTAGRGLGIAMQMGSDGDSYYWYPLFAADGGFAFARNPDGSYNAKKLGVARAGGIAASKRLATLVSEGVLSSALTYANAAQAFSAGRAPFFITGPWEIAAQKKALGADLMICPVPNWKGSKDEATPLLGVHAFFEPAKAKHAALAAAFLNDDVMTTAFQEGMYRLDPHLPAWVGAQAEVAKDPIQTGFEDYGEEAVPIPNIPQMAAVFDYLDTAEQRIASGGDPTDAIKQAAVSITAANAALK